MPKRQGGSRYPGCRPGEDGASWRVLLGARATRRAGAWREQWTLALERRSVRSSARVELHFRPGVAAATATLDGDPLGGLVLDRSISPARCELEVSRMLGSRGASRVGVRVGARTLATSDSPRLAVWSWIGGGGAPL